MPISRSLAIALTLLSIGTACGSAGPSVWRGATRRSLSDNGRVAFNQAAARLNVPLFWIDDSDADAIADANELRPLLFHRTSGLTLFEGGGLSLEGERAVASITAEAAAPPPSDDAHARLRRELDAFVPVLLSAGIPDGSDPFVREMAAVAAAIEDLHARQLGLGALTARIPQSDALAWSVVRRSWGPTCLTVAVPRRS